MNELGKFKSDLDAWIWTTDVQRDFIRDVNRRETLYLYLTCFMDIEKF
jgi:hypothetical protein